MRRKYISKQLKLLPVLLLTAALVISCGSGNQTEQTAPAEPEVSQPTEAEPMPEEQAAQPQPEAEQAQTVEEPGDEVASAGGGYQLGFEPGDPNLKASDATKASLQAGRPQFIDFFAFW